MSDEARLIALTQEAGDFVTGDDGFVIFWPNGSQGALNEWALRVLADELGRRNNEWALRLADALRAEGIN